MFNMLKKKKIKIDIDDFIKMQNLTIMAIRHWEQAELAKEDSDKIFFRSREHVDLYTLNEILKRYSRKNMKD